MSLWPSTLSLDWIRPARMYADRLKDAGCDTVNAYWLQDQEFVTERDGRRTFDRLREPLPDWPGKAAAVRELQGLTRRVLRRFSVDPE